LSSLNFGLASSIQESFDLDSFININKSPNNCNLDTNCFLKPIELEFGGDNFLKIKSDDYFQLLNPIEITLSTSDSAIIDVSKVMNRFPNGFCFGLYNFGENSLVTLEFSHPFYDSFQALKFKGILNVSPFFKLSTEFLPEKLISLNFWKTGLENSQIPNHFFKQFQDLEVLYLPQNQLTESPFYSDENPKVSYLSLFGNKLKHFDASELKTFLDGEEYKL